MAAIKLVTDLEPDKALQIAWRAAQDHGYRLTPIESYTFTATKGSRVLNHIMGGAIAAYCAFQISAKKYDDGSSDVVLENNSPKVESGRIGIGRVQGRAAELMDKIAAALQAGGGTIRERKDLA